MGFFDRFFGKQSQPQPTGSTTNPSQSALASRAAALPPPTPSVSRTPLAAFDPVAQVRKKERERGLPYGAAGVQSYDGLWKALKAVPAIDTDDPRLPTEKKQYSFANLIEEIDFFLGQSAAGGTHYNYETRHGVFVSTDEGHASSAGLEIAKVTDDSFWMWRGRHDPPSHQKAVAAKAVAPPSKPSEVGDQLFHASAKGDVAAVKALLERAAPPDHRRQTDGMTALHAAAWEGHIETVRHLLTSGANVNIADVQGWTALHYAAKGHNSKSLDEASKLEVARLLVSAGAAVRAMSESGRGLDGSNNPGVTPDDVAKGWDYSRIHAYLGSL